MKTPEEIENEAWTTANRLDEMAIEAGNYAESPGAIPQLLRGQAESLRAQGTMARALLERLDALHPGSPER